MTQVNFRVSEHEKAILRAIALRRGTSVADVAKHAVLKEIKDVQVDVAFELVKDGKVGMKHAWLLSGLSYHEFMVEWSRRGASESIPDEAEATGRDLARSIDLSRYLKE